MPREELTATWHGVTIRCWHYWELGTWETPRTDDYEQIEVDGVPAELDEFLCNQHEDEMLEAIREQNK